MNLDWNPVFMRVRQNGLFWLTSLTGLKRMVLLALYRTLTFATDLLKVVFCI